MENQDVQQQVQGQGQFYLIRQVILNMSKDMNFLGIMSIIYGALNCLTIIGAAIGIPVIFAGIRLREASEAFRAYADSNDMLVLERALERQSRVFYIYKIITIISLVLMALYILFIIGLLIFAGSLTNIFHGSDFV